MSFAVSGKVTDAFNNLPIEGATVAILNTNIGTFTDSTGFFSFCHIETNKQYTIKIDYLGYESDSIIVNTNTDKILNIRLKPTSIALKTVTHTAAIQERNKIFDKPEPNLFQLLNLTPGTATMNIGAGISKPVIRGLSLNRVAVVNRGIVQQNQQWGADHGMEINQFDMNYLTVYKGANSLLLGSSSMAAIDIQPYKFRNYDFFAGEAILFGASNNDRLGGAFTGKWQKNKWYVQGTFNYQDYSDYRVPAKKTNYKGEEILFPDKRIPNTAGKEHFVSGTIGFKERNITSYINVSNNYQKNGLFELDHHHVHEDDGHHHHEEEDLHNHDHTHNHEIVSDNSHSNIGMPYATSNHFTVTNNTEWKNSSARLLINTGYQFNHRKEFEHFHEHYEGQSEPVTNDNLAVDFQLKTYSTNARLYLNEKNSWKKTIGVSGEYMQNRIGGFEYFLPRYNQISGGLSFVNNFALSNKWILEAGIRYDISHMDITGYYDNSLAQNLITDGYDPSIVEEYAQRAYEVNKNFGSWSGNIGAKLEINRNLLLKANLSKSYRFPSANELGANGLHHAAYRYEIGNPHLKPEHGYSLDLGLIYDSNRQFMVDFSPFISYYSNFIYLDAIEHPTIALYDTQPYKYSQAEAIYGGAEYNINWRIIKNIEMSSAGSLVINKNLDDHRPLPFTPPFTMRNEIKYLKDIQNNKLSYYQFSISHHLYAKQSRVNVGEQTTSGTNVFNIGAGFDYKFGTKCKVIFNIQIQNIFNTHYLNHMSLYRRINIPEPGRNVQLFIRLPFNS